MNRSNPNVNFDPYKELVDEHVAGHVPRHAFAGDHDVHRYENKERILQPEATTRDLGARALEMPGVIITSAVDRDVALRYRQQLHEQR